MAKQENHHQHSSIMLLWTSRPPIPEWAEEGIFQSPCITIYKESELGKKKNTQNTQNLSLFIA